MMQCNDIGTPLAPSPSGALIMAPNQAASCALDTKLNEAMNRHSGYIEDTSIRNSKIICRQRIHAILQLSSATESRLKRVGESLLEGGRHDADLIALKRTLTCLPAMNARTFVSTTQDSVHRRPKMQFSQLVRSAITKIDQIDLVADQVDVFTFPTIEWPSDADQRAIPRWDAVSTRGPHEETGGEKRGKRGSLVRSMKVHSLESLVSKQA